MTSQRPARDPLLEIFSPSCFMHTAYPIGCGSKHYYEDHCNGSQITAGQGKNYTNYRVSLVYGQLYLSQN